MFPIDFPLVVRRFFSELYNAGADDCVLDTCNTGKVWYMAELVWEEDSIDRAMETFLEIVKRWLPDTRVTKQYLLDGKWLIRPWSCGLFINVRCVKVSGGAVVQVTVSEESFRPTE